MKKILSLILASIGLRFAYAQDLIPCPDGTMADPSIGCVTIPPSIVDSGTPVSEILFKVASLALTGVIAVATLILIYGGIRYATAIGDEDRLHQSKRLILWSIVGLVVALTARLLIGGVGNLLF